MKSYFFNQVGAFLLLLSATGYLSAELETFDIDPTHTYPTFEADHMGGLSLWRGKINSSTGVIKFDGEAQSGSVDVLMDMTTIDFGLDEMNEHAMSDDMFDVENYPTARYVGDLVFENGEPSEVSGKLTLHGITKPVSLKINSFKCMFHPMKLKKACGADAEGNLKRDDFGVDYAKAFGFNMDVKLRISVEGLKSN